TLKPRAHPSLEPRFRSVVGQPLLSLAPRHRWQVSNRVPDGRRAAPRARPSECQAGLHAHDEQSRAMLWNTVLVGLENAGVGLVTQLLKGLTETHQDSTLLPFHQVRYVLKQD